MPSWVTILLPIIGQLMALLTPALREMLLQFANDFYAKAKTTPNPVDDIVAALLLGILNIPTPVPK